MTRGSNVRAQRRRSTYEYFALPSISEVVQVPEPLTGGTDKVSENVVILQEKFDPRLTRVQPHPTTAEAQYLPS